MSVHKPFSGKLYRQKPCPKPGPKMQKTIFFKTLVQELPTEIVYNQRVLFSITYQKIFFCTIEEKYGRNLNAAFTQGY